MVKIQYLLVTTRLVKERQSSVMSLLSNGLPQLVVEVEVASRSLRYLIEVLSIIRARYVDVTIDVRSQGANNRRFCRLV